MNSKPKRRKALVVGTGGDDGYGLWSREVDHPKSLFSAVTGEDGGAAVTFDVYFVGRTQLRSFGRRR
jgi:hypothetical protein